MSNDEYLEWQTYHAALFWMQSTDDAVLFSLWRPSLDQFTGDECQEASRWMAENCAGNFRTEHLGLIRRRVFARRAESMRRAALEDFPSGPSICADCRGIGLVSVPHVRHVVDGVWQYYGNGKLEMVVACRCQRGASQAMIFDQLRAEKNICGMTLQEYAACVPYWRELLAEWKEQRANEVKTREYAAGVDKRLRLPIGEAKRNLIEVRTSQTACG